MINPPTDIILEVARAADQGRVAAATDRLVRFAQGAGPDSAAFAELLGEAGGRRAAGLFERPFDAASARIALQNRATLGASAEAGGLRGALAAEGRALTPHQQFEAFVLRNFVETMLPDDAVASYGSGTAGDIWKGMLADKISEEMARAGGIGIAEQLARIHPDARAAALDGSAGGLPGAAQGVAGDASDGLSGDGFFASLWRNG